jgi:AcrR family transcriptional regulator
LRELVLASLFAVRQEVTGTRLWQLLGTKENLVMAMLDQIAQERQRISERLTRVDAERTKLSGQLDELEVTERALKRFGGNGLAAEQPKKRRAVKAATASAAKPKANGGQQTKGTSLGDATLKAVQAHAKGISADEVRKYLSRKFGLTVRPNHLGSALQRHRRAGRLENRDQRWYSPSLA